MNKEKIGSFIKQLRIENELSQNELADKINVSRQAISQWERGINTPDLEALQDLSNLFNVSINEILIGKKESLLNSNEDFNNITISILQENEQKMVKIKKLKKAFLITTATSLIVSFAFLLYYFISFYNSIKVYTMYARNDSFEIDEGLFITSKSDIFFRLGNINILDNKKIKYVQLYYLDNNKETLIYQKDTNDVFIKDTYGYNEFFDIDNMKYITNHLYIRIIFDDNEKEETKIKFVEEYTNKSFFINKKKRIGDGKTTSTKHDNYIIPFSTKKMFCENDSCTLTIDNEDIFISYFDMSEEIKILKITDKKNNLMFEYYANYEELQVSKYPRQDNDERLSLSLQTINQEDEKYKYVEMFKKYVYKYLNS